MIRTALREWELKEELRRLEGERIGRLWDEGIASGAAREGPPIMERLKSKYEALQKKTQEAADESGMSYRLSPQAELELEEIGDQLPKTVQPMRSASSSV